MLWVPAMQARSEKYFLGLRQPHKSKRSFSRNQEMQWMSSDLHSNLTSNPQRQSNLRWSFQHVFLMSSGGSNAWIQFCGVYIYGCACELWDVCLYIYSGLAPMHLTIPVNLFSSVYLNKVIIQLFLLHFAARTLGALQNNNRSISEHNTNTVLK